MEKFDTDAMKRLQVEMLECFIEVCKNNGLKYFLLGGTCLGAVRHKGFIPWDDDIDVGMPRDDYEKFSEIAAKELPGHLFFQTNKTDPEYPMLFGKIRNSDTTYVEISSQKLNINHGVYIDVFPLDGVSENKLERKIIRKRKTLYNARIAQVFYTEKHGSDRLIKRIARKMICLLYPSVAKTVEKREKLCRKYPYVSSKIIANFGGAWGEKEVMPKEIFGEGTQGVFEGVSVTLPQYYDAYLTRLYGDYMQLPPVEKRIGHHYYVIADMEKSYKEYIG